MRRRATPGFDGERPAPPCQGTSCRQVVASQAPTGRVRIVRKGVLAGLHDCRSRWAACGSLAPVNNRQGTAGLAVRREPVRESMSDAGRGSFQTRGTGGGPPFRIARNTQVVRMIRKLVRAGSG